MLQALFAHNTRKGWIADLIIIILIIVVAFLLIYAIEYPHRIDQGIEYAEKEVTAHENLTKIAQSLEKYKRDFGMYTERKLLLRRYDPDVDQYRDPLTYEGYAIEIVVSGQDTTYTIKSPHEPFGSIVNGVRTWNGKPVRIPADTSAVDSTAVQDKKK